MIYMDNLPIGGQTKNNPIKPKHYETECGLQPHHVAEIFKLSYNVGTAQAYLLRAGKKEISTYEEDLEKAIEHIQFELESKRNKVKFVIDKPLNK